MKLETLSIHAGYSPDPTTKAVAVPIYQTTSYAFDDSQHGADLFDLKVEGNIYTRIMNPTNDVLEKRVAALEGGIGALAVASGMAAITYAIQAIAGVGDNIIAVSKLYGGTYNLMAHTFPTIGIETRFVAHDDITAIEEMIDKKTKALFCESITNPSGNIVDIQAMAEIAHWHGIPLIVDNTVATPYLCRPFEHGADIIIHSLTKYIGGHGTSIGGIIVDSGKFPWTKHQERFAILSTPDVAYHGVIYTDHFGEAAFIARCRVGPLRSTGAALSPFNAFLILQGLETLALRMERHTENALKVAQYLEKHPQVSWVKYAGLPTHPEHDLAVRYMKGKPASILSFGIKGGETAGKRFINALSLIVRLVNIGDAKSLACHPASTTHRQLNDEELAKAGVSRALIRLSIGIEHSDDIIADLSQALEAAK
ncbi:Homocysteine synthase [Xenorhabdus poinarii G6]|uniref:O-succinylhomoserine sulfhydrylase n=1 Tax=Xenorhabdus poinarii G6 TaxID=1354304 RepID=A0A068R225_9GAMM|nr:bifunctional O-acetylhomoserine aminocarboxypropyltransferase/cysteine synthase [Xenorhabdus poinarii]CDG20165.1 Homocysteine synthase [Xenorhabdus poinarii G6]